MPVRTFVDSNILIAAHRGEPVLKQPCLQLLSDHRRHFVSSDFVYLEIMPKALYERRMSEALFYRTYFDSVRIWMQDVESIVRIAREESERSGLAAMDALHIAAAHLAEADVFVTAEQPGKPLYRTGLVSVEYVGSARIT